MLLGTVDEEINVDAILVLMQVGHDGDWNDRGLPEVVTEYGRAKTPQAAGIEWLIENHPNANEHWQLLVWALGDQPYDRDHPDAVVRPEDFQKAVAKRRSTDRSRLRRRALRVPVGKVVHKVHATEDLLGTTILVTQDRANSSAPGAEGPWYPAAAPGPDVVAAGVNRIDELTRGGRQLVKLGTKAGLVGWMPLGHPVIPVEEA